MRPKRIPMRMCTGCGEMKPKKELVRVVKSPEGEVSLDLTGKNRAEVHTFAKVPNVCVRRENPGALKRHFP